MAAGTALQLDRLRYESPRYRVLERRGDLEVRRYEDRLVAETVVEGDERAVTREGFRRLAGYIFGGNVRDERVAMTTPVERAPAGERIAMTTPVERAPRGDRWVVTFTMPRRYGEETLPQPKDPRVHLRVVPGGTVAALRFGGRVDPEAQRAREAELLGQLREHGLRPDGHVTLAQYDPPWVLGPFRRNEVLVPVAPAAEAERGS